MPETLTVTDNRTGKTFEIPVTHDTIRALDLRQIKVKEDDFGLMTYDPGYTNTSSCISRVTYIDGEKGILEYRGYPIEQLAEKSSFMEVAYLLLNGELPKKDELSGWEEEIHHHTVVHENIKRQMESFRYDAHPMGMIISTVAALSTFYPEAKNVRCAENRRLQIKRLIAKVPTIAAFTFRHSQGHPYVYPNNKLSYTENFLTMMFRMVGNDYEPNPAIVKALDVLFTLHADHEQNCSASVMRAIGSSEADPYSAWAGAAAALYGPLHGGANEAVLRMLNEIGDVSKVPEYMKKCKNGELRLMGFGHRVYKNYDPRARIIKKCADDVFEVTGRNPLLDVALELERIALEDEYFVKRKLYPNVDFYSGLIYQAIGLPVTMFPVLFAIPRTIGWLAQWAESLEDKEQRIQRPRQVFLGERERDYVAMDQR
ncbi:citrate synthase [Thalassoglobus polymorphus]|uniref:Citrate synthase n=1 Tax=Thalassoglobus polymorphus TaxID=2527994 RepID=A0A517QPX4_9PLAN|nr:citrate synthase [Thalassoglobus polymorphus]QDT33654.1 Citrate synthase [Thalassoglobus polymorphus]